MIPHTATITTERDDVYHKTSLDRGSPIPQIVVVARDERAKRVGQRIREAREARGWSQAALAKAINQSQSAISFWEKGEREPGRETVDRIAKATGVNVNYLELSDNDRPASGLVAVVGYVAAGSVAALFEEAQGPLDHVDAPANATSTTVGLLVQGVSLGPAWDNAVIFYDDVRSPVTPDLHGRLCVVGLDDGRVLVKILKAAGDGTYHLFSNTLEEPLLNQSVSWAARVKAAHPR